MEDLFLIKSLNYDALMAKFNFKITARKGAFALLFSLAK